MRRLMAGFLLAALAVCSHLQAQVLSEPEVDRDEVIRRGDMVEAVNGYGDEDPIGDALAPPEDDSYKFFVTVITQKGCPPCEALKRDFAENRDLRAFVNPGDYTQSWAHYNVYDSADATQMWRFRKIKFNGYPTVLLQPPLNGRFGPHKTIIKQFTGYDGDARKLSARMSEAIKTYVTTISDRRPRPLDRLLPRRSAPAEEDDSASAPAKLRAIPASLKRSPPEAKVSEGYGQRPAPFDLPDDSTPATPAPGPLVIPGPVDADAPATPKKPDAEKPAAANELPKTPTAYIVFDGPAREATSDRRIIRVVEGARARFKTLTERVLDFDSAKNVFPQLDKTRLPTVVIVDEGKVKDHVSADTLPLIEPKSEGFPWESLLTIVAALASGGSIPWLALGGIGLYFLKKWRDKKKIDADGDGKPDRATPILDRLESRLEKIFARFEGTDPPK